MEKVSILFCVLYFILMFFEGKSINIDEKGLIENVKNSPMLWDLHSPEYKQSTAKINEWNRIGCIYQITG